MMIIHPSMYYNVQSVWARQVCSMDGCYRPLGTTYRGTSGYRGTLPKRVSPQPPFGCFCSDDDDAEQHQIRFHPSRLRGMRERVNLIVSVEHTIPLIIRWGFIP